MFPPRKFYSSLDPTEVAILPGLLHNYYVQLLPSNSLYCWIILSLLVSLLVIRWSSDLGTYKNFTLGCCRKFEVKASSEQSCDSLLSNTDLAKKRIWKQRRSSNTLLTPGISPQSLDKYELPLPSLAQFSWGPNYNLLAAGSDLVRLLQLTAAELGTGHQANSSEFADVLVLCMSYVILK